jgi:hypothetical protein
MPRRNMEFERHTALTHIQTLCDSIEVSSPELSYIAGAMFGTTELSTLALDRLVGLREHLIKMARGDMPGARILFPEANLHDGPRGRVCLRLA